MITAGGSTACGNSNADCSGRDAEKNDPKTVTTEPPPSDLLLADTVGPGMRLLIVGLNPSIMSAERQVGFVRPGNRFWPAALRAGIVTCDRDPDHALVHDRVGMTNLVARATRRADELSPGEFRDSLPRLDDLCARFQPEAVCVVGITGWRHATGNKTASLGWQKQRLGGRPVYVMPNPSGLNAHTNIGDLVAHFQRAVAGPTAAEPN